MERITIKHLRALVGRLNRLTGSPMEYAQTYESGKPFCANVGNYHISQAYGGYCLQRVHNTGGGVSCPLSSGHVTAREAYNQIHAFINGIESTKGE